MGGHQIYAPVYIWNYFMHQLVVGESRVFYVHLPATISLPTFLMFSVNRACVVFIVGWQVYMLIHFDAKCGWGGDGLLLV